MTMDIHKIRLTNLDLVVNEKFGGIRARLADALHRQASSISRYWSKSSSNRRTIDSETAREVEVLIGKSNGWMDVLHSSIDDDMDADSQNKGSSEQKLISLFLNSDDRGKENILAVAKIESDRNTLPGGTVTLVDKNRIKIFGQNKISNRKKR